MSLAPIQVDQQTMRVRFNSYDLENYRLFLKTKALPESTLTFDWESDTYEIQAAARFAHLLGVEVPKPQVDRLPLAEHLFDYQRWIVEMALDAKRFAIWCDTGLGKAPMGLEWARQVQHLTAGRVLFVMPLAVIGQYTDEARRFYGDALPITRLDSRSALREWCTGSASPSGRFWRLTKDGDKDALALYERHYSARRYRDGRDRKLFVGPGEKHVLISHDGTAVFAWRKHKSDDSQTGINCSVFRNEGESLSSEMIREAMDWAWQRWPGERLYTYVDPEKIDSSNPGFCFKQAGWRRCGTSKSGLHILEATYPLFGITNYEKFLPGRGEPEVTSEIRHLSGIVLDESSALKTGGGKIKWALIKSCRGIEYKLSCTATPAPNEAMEYASQAAFLEKLRTEADILWTWFQRDKYGAWSIKPHAHAAFFAFMASWSIYMRDPAAFGFNDILASLPKPIHHEERIELTDEQRQLMTEFAVTSGKGLFADHKLGVKERAKFAQMARGFLYEGGERERTIRPVDSRKPVRVAEIATEKLFTGRQALIWTAFDEEGEIILREMHAMIDQQIRDAEVDEVRRRPEVAGMRRLDPDIEAWQGRVAILTGSQSPAERQAILDRFRTGEILCLISKPSLIGYGLNLQFVTVMVFSGIDDSMERRYQAIRRAYRFGQTEPVQVWTVYVPELEGVMFDNVSQKEARFLEEVAAQERHYRRALGMEPAA